uniref:HAT C-terminal dimerisation domain-containing protein n=1 Tax=Oryzias latipes TaxID=8090 RepID=A0A3P9JCA8_ORYLA
CEAGTLDGASAGTMALVCKPNCKSVVWMYFGLKADGNGLPVRIVISKGNTTNLRSHLRRRHPAEFIEITNLATTRAFAEAVPLRPLPAVGPTVSSQVVNAIVNFLITDLQPPSVVEGSGFRQLLHTLLPAHRELPKPWLLEGVMRDQHIRGRVSLAQLLRQKTGGAERDEVSDHTAPLECEPWKCQRPSTNQREALPFVTLSGEVWLHSWQGNPERYLTLWAHCIDENFSFHNQALATRKLTSSRENDLEALEAQVKAMTEEWGGFRPNFIVLGVEGTSRMGMDPATSEKSAEATGSCAHPNSTTFLEREDSASPEEVRALEPGEFGEGFPFVPCFFSSVQVGIEELMAHPVIRKTLSQFQDHLSELFLPPTQSKGSLLVHAHKLLKSLPKEEQAQLTSWAHCRPAWKDLYPLLSTLVKHKSLISDVLKEVKGERSAAESVLEDLCLVLKPLDVACQTLAKEAFPRLSLIKPILTGLLSRHLVARPGDSSSILKEVKRLMRRKLTSCYSSPAVNRVLCVACSLDPQFRELGFMEEKVSWEFSFLPSKKKRKIKLLENFFCLNEEPGPTFQPGLSGMEFLLGDLFCSASKNRESSAEESVDMEISVFRADKGASLGMEPLQWWRTKAVQFPLLASVARAYLAAPAVAGNAAQEFIQDGTTNRRRSNIPPESLDTMLFLHHNHISVTDGGPAAASDRG